MPIASIATDELYSARELLLTHDQAAASPGVIAFLWVRFRHDKSKFNFTYHRFLRVPGSRFCPVTAVLVTFCPATSLGLPADMPVGQFRGRNGQLFTIRGDHMQRQLRQACRDDYSNPNHHPAATATRS